MEIIQFRRTFVVAAARNGNEFLRSHHIDRKSAEIALNKTVDIGRLFVTEVETEFATNGNVRIWQVFPD